MARFFKKYSAQFQLTNSYMLGRVVGEGGKNQRLIQTKYGITMDIQEDKTVSVKGDRKNVKLAEDEIIKILEEQSFEAMISENFVGQIVGKNGSRIKEIRETSGAHVKIEERSKDSDPGFKCLGISGR